MHIYPHKSHDSNGSYLINTEDAHTLRKDIFFFTF